MNLFSFILLVRSFFRTDPVDIERIQDMGLLTVKLCQLLALRPDILPTEKCIQLQKLYQDGAHLPPEDTQHLLQKVSPKGFLENFTSLDMHPIASASIGQVHAGRLKNGDEVVIKIIKNDYLKTFQRDLKRMRRWIKIGLLLYPPLRRVGNPMGLLDHIEDYTMRELDLRNEIKGCAFLEKSLKILNHSGFVISKLSFPKMHPELSNSNVLVMERITAPTIQTHLEQKTFMWKDMLELFRIHGAFMFGLGRFHGDLHPGNSMLDKNGVFTFIDNGAICESPKNVRESLFRFFYFLANGKSKEAYSSLLNMAKKEPDEQTKKEYFEAMHKLYNGFSGKSVSEISLTQQMMKTVKTAVLAGCEFGEESFPIIRSLMYLDGMVLKGHPTVDLISSMKPYLQEFSNIVELNLDFDEPKKTKATNLNMPA